jgi:predicted RNA binding protein with dsRBD fold (UPF0201 family)
MFLLSELSHDLNKVKSAVESFIRKETIEKSDEQNRRKRSLNVAGNGDNIR